MYLGSRKIAKNPSGVEIGPTIPSGSVSGVKIITVQRSEKSRVDYILKRLRPSVVELNQSTCNGLG